MPGVTMFLRDQSNQLLRTKKGGPFFQTTTATDGSFKFKCVPHKYVQVWMPAYPSVTNFARVVPPEGWNTGVIVVQAICGNLVGKVTDADTGNPIAGANVSAGNSHTVTDVNGDFTIVCFTPVGPTFVLAYAPGYDFNAVYVLAYAVGDSQLAEIKLHRIPVMAIKIMMNWGFPPDNLDSHLSGPNPAGGRFHFNWYTAQPPPPVSFVEIDKDANYWDYGNGQHGPSPPETITIHRSAATGNFVAGDYRYWVLDYIVPWEPRPWNIVQYNAAVAVCIVDPQGGLHQLGHYDIAQATGAYDNLWHVVDLSIDANGYVTLNVIQTFPPSQPGFPNDTMTVL